MIRVIKWIGLAVLVLLAIWVAMGNPAHAQETPLVRCRLESTNIDIGAGTWLYLEVEDVVDLNGYQLYITFDSDLVDIFEDVYDNPDEPPYPRMTLGDFLDPIVEIYNEIDNISGNIDMTLTKFPPDPPQSGSGQLAYGYVFGNANGTVDFIFEDLILFDYDGNEIPHNIESCSLMVGKGAQDTETPTATVTDIPPVPTATPSPTEIIFLPLISGHPGYIILLPIIHSSQ